MSPRMKAGICAGRDLFDLYCFQMFSDNFNRFHMFFLGFHIVGLLNVFYIFVIL